MAETFKFELVTPERVLLSEDVSQVVVPGTEGDFTVLAGHAPVISTIRPGVIVASVGDGRSVRLFVKGGFAEVDQNRLTVLAQRALEVEAMDAALIAAELKVAEGELATATDDGARLAAHAAVEQLRTLAA
ncbi:MAG TPA: F0F1 ATP synthase subunit epsilon [Hyphomicrobiaceae bacterium]|jgi:F-type H+-transporting ATPase subunit epsilon|nr:F0F1 ATP synthase subunit epsilon [Hyphomicrobiaceae bacterium]